MINYLNDVIVDTPIIDNKFILLVALILFAIGVYLAYKTGTPWLYSISGLLWFIPLFIIENIFISIFSISMILFWFLITFTQSKGGE